MKWETCMEWLTQLEPENLNPTPIAIAKPVSRAVLSAWILHGIRNHV